MARAPVLRALAPQPPLPLLLPTSCRTIQPCPALHRAMTRAPLGCCASCTSSPPPDSSEGDGQSASAAPPGSVVVYANELEYFGDTTTGNIRRCVKEGGGRWPKEKKSSKKPLRMGRPWYRVHNGSFKRSRSFNCCKRCCRACLCGVRCRLACPPLTPLRPLLAAPSVHQAVRVRRRQRAPARRPAARPGGGRGGRQRHQR